MLILEPAAGVAGRELRLGAVERAAGAAGDQEVFLGADELDVDALAELRPDLLDGGLVEARVEVAHPEGAWGLVRRQDRGRGRLRDGCGFGAHAGGRRTRWRRRAAGGRLSSAARLACLRERGCVLEGRFARGRDVLWLSGRHRDRAGSLRPGPGPAAAAVGLRDRWRWLLSRWLLWLSLLSLSLSLFAFSTLHSCVSLKDAENSREHA